MTDTISSVPDPFRLHLGGHEVKDGWHILNAQRKDGINFLGDIRDLTQFPDDCCDEIYGSHIIEHLS